MATLTMAQMISYARAAGFAGNDLIIAGAVGMAESGGRTSVHNPVLSYVVGVWQINTRAHPQYTPQEMENPAANARAAYSIFRASGWKAWSTYTSGAYKRHMAAATKAAGSAAGDITTSDIGGPVNPIAVGTNLGTIMSTINAAQNPAVWRRVLLIIVGVVMILIGIVKMTVTPKNIKLATQIAEVIPK